ncbi:MAG: hypothetical protein E7329_09660 [Clostridiales bacterium]|nr:hypothetical protein [Clostridiales bacterium]
MTKKILSMMLALMMVMSIPVSGLAMVESRNPLIDPKPLTEYAETEDEFVHVLLLGNEMGFGSYWGSAGASKKKVGLMAFHTDVVMVVSFNLTKNRVDFVSIPRDSMTYVPGVQGIYKLNAAFNCAETPEDGIQNCLAAASQMLGGIKIDKYMMVDMGAMVELGQALGGVEFVLDMTYQGAFRYFWKGLQEMDGYAIMDYVRARQNATIDDNDLGRTRRGRSMMIAILKKLQKEQGLVQDLFDVINTTEHTIMTNITQEEVNSLLPFISEIKEENIGSHVMDGRYRFALVDWNMHFVDQNHRLQVLKDVYGLNAEKRLHESLNYANWLVEEGFTAVRLIKRARTLIEYAQAKDNLTENQQKMLDELIAAHDLAVETFDQAADTLDSNDNSKMVKARRALRDLGKEAEKILGYPEEIAWSSNTLWYVDPIINEYWDLNWR